MCNAIPDLNWRFAPRWRHDCISGIFAEVGKLNDVRVTKLGANQKGVFWVLAACRPRVRQIKLERQRGRTCLNEGTQVRGEKLTAVQGIIGVVAGGRVAVCGARN